MSRRNRAQPRISVLSASQIDQIHSHSLQILSSVGVRVDSERARQVFLGALGSDALDGTTVRIPAELVEWAREAAPSSVKVYNRAGDLAFQLPDQARFGIGVTALYYQDPTSDKVVPFARCHMESLTRLGNMLPSFDLVSTIGIVQDVPAELSDLYGVLDMMANTVKPLVILVSHDPAFPMVLDLLEHLHGSLADRPFVIPYLNPITPLVINQGTSDKMFTAIEYELPFIYSNYGMAGASTPITPAGTLALLNAELLAGLTLCQLIQEGSSIILGSLPAYFDMKGMGNFYDPISYVVDLACAEMMAYYQLPHAGTSGSGMGWSADLLAGGHQWMNHLLTCMGHVGLAPFVGDNLGSKAMSPAIIVYADEVIAQARRIAQGFAIDESAFEMADISSTGIGGTYLMASSTLEQFRQAYWRGQTFSPLTLEEWEAQGRPQADKALRSRTSQILAESQPPSDHAELLAKGEAYIHKVHGL